MTTYFGDCREVMNRLITEGVKVSMCVTSPPYWGLRDYGVEGQLGLEKTPEEYIANMVEVFRLVRELLADDGTLWLNIGDSYSDGGRKTRDTETDNKGNVGALQNHRPQSGLKQKDLVGIPWMLAFALRADGWYLRSDIIWNKPNPMPESVKDRPTRAHEYIFLMSKSARYYYDADAIKEPIKESSISRINQPNFDNQTGGEKDYGDDSNRSMRKTLTNFKDKQRGHSRRHDGFNDRWDGMSKDEQQSAGANKRDVWTVATKPYSGAHFATYPPELIEPCILAGSRPGDIVLDPFFGSGTTGEVAQRFGRQYIGIELNREYEPLQRERTSQMGMIL